MKIFVAKKAGFCMGVKMALDMVLATAKEERGPIYVYGSLIHNPQVIQLLEKRGIKVLAEGEDPSGKVVIIRTHGISPAVRQGLKDRKAILSDATCPLVAKVQSAIRKRVRSGYNIIIVGNKDHAEIKGLIGFAEGKGMVVNSIEEVEPLPHMENVCVVGQTTLNREKYRLITETIIKRFPNTIVEDTICEATDLRQSELLELSKMVDAVVVVGGRNSANTRHLGQISESVGTPTFMVETEKEIDPEILGRFELVGVTAGASTPNWMINRVIERLKEIDRRKQKGWKRFGVSLLDFLVKGNIYIAVGAAFITYAASVMLAIPAKSETIIISALYFFSVYNLNHLADREAAEFNEPERAIFYERFGHILLGASYLSIISAIILAFMEGVWQGGIILAAAILGRLYSVNIIPASWEKIRARRLKDIPASKDLFVALAWATVAGLLPAIKNWGDISLPSLYVTLIFIFILIYIRTVLFDIRDIEGDHFAGIDTIPILIGKEYTKLFLLTLTSILTAILYTSSRVGMLSPIGYYMLLPVGYTLFYLYLYHRRIISHGIAAELVIDGTLILSGLIGMVYLFI
ncbi:MAG: 4-hydroxy-3-methylbut-2-enyl diphosphate reductase [Nitrospinae bacterium]|nr:4-hydroxy-3-methylbut-2-enyl diphosphate reductase [Nitrospinota bacterium]